MSWETFKKSVALVERCGQRTAYLHNFGEPLLHPHVAEFVRYCSERGVMASFFTNGVLITDEVLADLSDAGLRFLYLSEHTKGELDRVQLLIARGNHPIEIRDTFRPVRRELHSWAGQMHQSKLVSLELSSPRRTPCIFERERAAVVLWDGRLNVCCIDVEGRGVQGTVDNYLANPESYEFKPIRLCASCTLMRGDEDLT